MNLSMMSEGDTGRGLTHLSHGRALHLAGTTLRAVRRSRVQVVAGPRHRLVAYRFCGACWGATATSCTGWQLGTRCSCARTRRRSWTKPRVCCRTP